MSRAEDKHNWEELGVMLPTGRAGVKPTKVEEIGTIPQLGRAGNNLITRQNWGKPHNWEEQETIPQLGRVGDNPTFEQRWGHSHKSAVVIQGFSDALPSTQFIL